MPIDKRRRDAIAAAVATYASAHPSVPLPPYAARLLATMFSSEDVCQRSLQDLADQGFGRTSLLGALRRLIGAGFLSKERGFGRPNTYRLHLPPRGQP
jgi:hypothetical protein